MGTNKPVRITDAKSGLIRRLIDVSPTGDKVEPNEYKTIMKHIPFELGPIAYHCQEVYLEDPAYYDGYIPIAMLGASNDFYNYIVDSYPVFKREDGTSLKAAWEMYKTYNEEAKVSYPLSQRAFKEELKNYFHDYTERFSMEDGTRVRSYYSGFRTEKFEEQTIIDKPEPTTRLIQFDGTASAFDKDCADCPAQYATSKETPSQKWEKVTKTLSQLDTSKLHYVKVPKNHIVIDFDIPDENGNKCFDLNLAEASKWPPTYAEVSKGGQGIHLHYVYAEPGMYGNIALLDIASMHPSSIIAEDLFGPVYTKRFREIRDARVAIKHKEFDKARKMLNGALAKYLTDESAADALAQALKIAINSVYGLTSASFENPFHDNRNKDNIVAKRGALFMINLKHEVQKRGFVVAHIKTDSIKIPDATPEIIQFVMDYGKMYGYIFEHEATYDRMCLVNNAVYIAKYKDGKHAGEWTATGTQFQIPYVFKKLFSHEEITFEDIKDLCDLADFEIEGRVVLIDKRSGRVWR